MAWVYLSPTTASLENTWVVSRLLSLMILWRIVQTCVCVCVCVMNVMCMWAYSPVWAHVEARDRKLTLECLLQFYFVRHGVSLDLEFAFALDLLASKLLGSTCLCRVSPRTGVNVYPVFSMGACDWTGGHVTSALPTKPPLQSCIYSPSHFSERNSRA